MFLVDLAETVDGLMICMFLIQVSISTFELVLTDWPKNIREIIHYSLDP